MRFLNAPLARLPYSAFGVGLMAAKIGIDFAIAHAFGKPYSVLYYVSPIDAPLFHPGEQQLYWFSLACAATPFMAIGVALTQRRLRDADLSPWLALLFFAPFANLLFFLMCALVPSRAKPKELPADGVYRAPPDAIVVNAPERSPRSAMFISASVGTVIALGTMGLAVGILQSYGVALMLGAPTICGFATGAMLGRLRPGSRFKEAAIATSLATAVCFATLIAFALEGAVCLVMAAPLVIPPAFLGAYIGLAASSNSTKRGATAAIVTSVMLLPALFVLDRVSPLPPLTPPAVRTAMEINAPPEVVWRHTVRVSEMLEPTELAFAVGISYPIRATLDEDREGAVRRCEFNTGTALETVKTWDPPRELVFDIDSQPDPMREATLWRGPRQPHLDGAVRNRIGRFTLEPLPGGRTRLVGESEYTVSITPESYWRLWSDEVVHAIHGRVMSHVKEESERESQGVALHDSP